MPTTWERQINADERGAEIIRVFESRGIYLSIEGLNIRVRGSELTDTDWDLLNTDKQKIYRALMLRLDPNFARKIRRRNRKK